MYKAMAKCMHAAVLDAGAWTANRYQTHVTEIVTLLLIYQVLNIQHKAQTINTHVFFNICM